jgi:uncharacterized transporter YbjL
VTNDESPAPATPPPPYAQPVPYGSVTAPGQPYAYYAQPPTNTLAIVALILAFFVSVAGVICGHIALSQIKRTGEQGHGLALAAVVVGYVITGLYILFIIAYIIIIAFVVTTSLNSSGSFGD